MGNDGSPFDLDNCQSCGEPIVHTFQGPYLDAVHHLSECVTLHDALIDYDADAEDERRERM